MSGLFTSIHNIIPLKSNPASNQKKTARLTHAGVISYVKQKHPGLTPLIFFDNFSHNFGQTLVQSLSPFSNIRVTKKYQAPFSCLHFPLGTYYLQKSFVQPTIWVEGPIQSVRSTWCSTSNLGGKQQNEKRETGGWIFGWTRRDWLQQKNNKFFFFGGGGWARSQNSNNYCRCFFYNKKRFAQVQSYHYICLKHL